MNTYTATDTSMSFSHRGRWQSIGLFLGLLAVFILSPVHQFSDSSYSMLVSESLLRHRTTRLDRYIQSPLDPGIHPGSESGDLPYHLFERRGHIYYVYPLGTSVLSVPFVAVSHLFGMSAVFPDGSYNHLEERRIQFRLAALLMAFFGVVVFQTARLMLPTAWSLPFACTVALTTQVWTTASRGLWSHTWAILLVMLALLLILRQIFDQGRIRPVLLATIVIWAYFTRPTMVVAVIVVGIYVALRQRRAFALYASTVTVWMALFVARSWWLFDQVLPPYYRPGKLGTTTFWEGLAGNLVSPSRGLLVFLPHLLVVLYLIARYPLESNTKPLATLAALAAAGHLLIVAGFPMWWGGHGFGPRLMTDALPWLVLLSLVAIRSRLMSTNGVARNRIEATVAIILASCAFCIHAGGAMSERSNEWNWRPVNVDERPARVWDWRDAQFLAPFSREPLPDSNR